MVQTAPPKKRYTVKEATAIAADAGYELIDKSGWGDRFYSLQLNGEEIRWGQKLVSLVAWVIENPAQAEQAPVVHEAITTEAKEGDYFRLPFQPVYKVISRHDDGDTITYSVQSGKNPVEVLVVAKLG